MSRRDIVSLLAILAVVIALVGCKPKPQPAAVPGADSVQVSAAPVDSTPSTPDSATVDSTQLESFLAKSVVPYEKPLPAADIPGYRTGMEAYQAGDFVTAQRELRNATRKQKLDWEIWFYVGMAAYMNNDIREAVHGFEMVERYSAPELPRMHARWFQANSYLKEGSVSRGTKVLEFIARQNREYAAESRALLARIKQLGVADRVIEPIEPVPVRAR